MESWHSRWHDSTTLMFSWQTRVAGTSSARFPEVARERKPDEDLRANLPDGFRPRQSAMRGAFWLSRPRENDTAPGHGSLRTPATVRPWIPFKDGRGEVDPSGVNRRFLALSAVGVFVGATVLAGCGSSTTASQTDCPRAKKVQVRPLPKELHALGDKLASMGYTEQPGRYTSCSGAEFSARPGPVIETQFLKGGDIIGTYYVAAGSTPALQQTRDDFLAAGQARGFQQPVLDGDRFYMTVPVTRGTAQKDLVGWTVPGEGVVMVQRSATGPVESDASSWLQTLTAS